MLDPRELNLRPGCDNSDLPAVLDPAADCSVIEDQDHVADETIYFEPNI